MSATKALRNLQARQREHDTRAHQDIYYLPYPDRMKHLTFHVAKYAGRLAPKDVTEAAFVRTIVDTFIISLSAGDVLRLDFSEALNKWGRVDQYANLVLWKQNSLRKVLSCCSLPACQEKHSPSNYQMTISVL